MRQLAHIAVTPTWPLEDSSSIRVISRRMSGRGWCMDRMTVVPLLASCARMSTTAAALLLSRPVARRSLYVRSHLKG